MDKIKSISEAFSTQPVSMIVTDPKARAQYQHDYDIEKIDAERDQIGQYEYVDYYVGYNFEGKKIFKYLANSVNVHYQ